MMDRAIRAAKVEPALYEEVERDENATTEAAIVVAIAAVASAIGAAIGSPNTFIGSFLTTLIGGLVGWVVWSYITYFVGTRLMNGTATPGEMLRTIGYAQAPQVLGILGFIPVIGFFIRLAVALWSLWAGIVAVRQALDFDTGKAVITVLIGFVVYVVVLAIIGLILSPLFLIGAR